MSQRKENSSKLSAAEPLMQSKTFRKTSKDSSFKQLARSLERDAGTTFVCASSVQLYAHMQAR